MNVTLVSITKPLVPGIHNANDFIAYVAKVSNPSNQLNILTADKLIQYLIVNNHWSPFELVHLTMEIETTRDIARQILRHRSFSFQEFSQRYADPTQALGFSTREARLQDTKNRQNSIETNDDELNAYWYHLQMSLIDHAKGCYKWAIDNGLAKEQARAVLPEGLTKSRMYMSGSLRSWWHYCALRSGNGTQKEHQLIAQECLAIVLNEFPVLRGVSLV